MSSQEEHRHHPRRDPPRGVSLTLRRDPPQAGEKSLQLSCRDVSRTGLGVAFPHSITPDTDVELWVTLPDDERRLHLYGTVAWCAAPLGQWRAGIALNLERSDGHCWSARFDQDHDLNGH
ncbi:MAG TPA: PilZ domain-containing protein [Alcanivorax sp.]|nr:PilZ domain-containing protein [Alcanivorax sp.]